MAGVSGDEFCEVFDRVPFASNKERFPNRPLTFDRPCTASVRRLSVASALVHEDELVWQVGDGHMLPKLFAFELVPFDGNLRQL